MEQKQRNFDGWMWATLTVAIICFAIGALTFNAVGGRGIAQLAIFLGFAASLSLLLRISYWRSR